MLKKDIKEKIPRRQGIYSQKSGVKSGLEMILVELEPIERILE